MTTLEDIKVSLKDYEDIFGNEAGEDEDLDILSSSYFRHPEFDKFFEEKKKLAIVSARKGVGKSALLAELQYQLINSKNLPPPIVISVVGNDLLGLGDFENKSSVYLENYWKQIICKRIIIEIGNTINLALSDDAISMVEIAEIEGFKTRNIIGSLTARLKAKIPLIEGEVTQSPNKNSLKLLENYQNKYESSKIWLLIDDIDSKYINDISHQDRISSFFSAIRYLSVNIPNLICRTTVRSEVWSCLKHIEDMDKMQQYIMELEWKKSYMRIILAKKILSYLLEKNPDSTNLKKIHAQKDYNKIIEYIFESPISWGDRGDAHIFDAISAFSNRRPRWMAQLCKLSAKKAYQTPKKKKISLINIEQSLEYYGGKRRDDLIKEHKHQFSQIELLIDALRAVEKEFSYSKIISTIRENFIVHATELPQIDGILHANEHQLGKFIFKIGIISHKHFNENNFTHFTDDPDLFDSLLNKNDQILWSIHPSYRNFLNIK